MPIHLLSTVPHWSWVDMHHIQEAYPERVAQIEVLSEEDSNGMVEIGILPKEPSDSLRNELQTMFGERCRSTGDATDSHGRRVDRIRLAPSKVLASSDSNLQDYVDRLQRMKIKPLGQGDFSYTFIHPHFSDVAVRISDSDGDSGYSLWLKFVLDNQTNPYVPKVFGTAKGSTQRDDINIVFMERLVQSTLEDYLAFMTRVNPKLKGQEIRVIRDNHYNFPSVTTIKEHQKSDPDLHEVLDYIDDHKMRFEPDLVWRNVMKRPSDNHPVITDPFYG